MTVRFLYNGTQKTADVVPDLPAAMYLDEAFRTRGACNDGSCLQCTVLFGGRVVSACSLPAFRLDNAEILDIDGLSSDELYRTISRAFEKIGISRCRTTYAGMVLLAYQLLSDNALPGDDELHEYSRHLTNRCTSREEYERAVRLAGRVYKRKHHGEPR